MILIVLPAYNEQESIAELLGGIKRRMEEHRLDYRVVVVNDGSTDRTEQTVLALQKEIPITYVKHEANAGLGAAIKTGFTKAVESGKSGDVIVTMDSDNTHDPGLIPQMARLIGEGRDVVIASRYRRGSRVVGVPFPRRVLSRGAALLFQAVCPIPGVRDYTSGFRAYRWEILHNALSAYGSGFVSAAGFSCMVEILLKLRALGVSAVEAPMVLRYDRKSGASKMKVSSNIVDTLALLWRGRKSSGAP